MSSFTNAQVCLNGHIITLSTEQEPFNMENYCADCGAKTITKCPSCGKQIRGNSLYDTMGFASVDVNREPDAYCPYCGKPYPWTQTALETAEAIIREDETLTEEQMQQFCECLPDLLIETKKTNIALIRYKKFVDKAASVTGPALLDVLTGVASEVMKDKLFGM